jgi:hypothetical protein
MKEDPNDPKKEGYEPDVMATAVPASPQGNEPPIPAGHARFYCSKCHTVSLCLCLCLCHCHVVASANLNLTVSCNASLNQTHLFYVVLRPSKSSNLVEVLPVYGIQFHHSG